MSPLGDGALLKGLAILHFLNSAHDAIIKFKVGV